jgi:SWI/SNF related-matrix-associated actin-dependent regulator of chromatin subfamily C
MVGFLASAVSPAVAGAAAMVALSTFAKEASVYKAKLEAKNAESKREREAQQQQETKQDTAPMDTSPSSEHAADSKEKEKEHAAGDKDVKTDAAPAPAPTPTPTTSPPPSTATHTSTPLPPLEITPASIKAAAAAALASATVKARLLAEREEREIHNLMAQIIEAQIKKMELKVKFFSEIEDQLERDKLQLEQQRQTLLNEKQAFAQKMLTTPAPTPTTPQYIPKPAATPTQIQPPPATTPPPNTINPALLAGFATAPQATPAAPNATPAQPVRTISSIMTASGGGALTDSNSQSQNANGM